MYRSILFIMIFSFILGCGSKKIMSIEEYHPTESEISVMLQDVYRHIEQNYNPAKSSIQIIKSGGSKSLFENEIENFLRTRGYAIGENGKHKLTYCLCNVKDSPDLIMLRIEINQVFQINALYNKKKDTFKLETGLSIKKHVQI